MENTKIMTETNSHTLQDKEVEVLYQKLGDQWFAFSVIDGDVFMSPVSDETIRQVKNEQGHHEDRSRGQA